MVALDDQIIIMKTEVLTSSPDLDHKYSEKTSLLASHTPKAFAVHYSLLDAGGVDDSRSSRRTEDCGSEKKRNQDFKARMDANFHLVIEGSSFHVVRNDFPDVYQKVRA